MNHTALILSESTGHSRRKTPASVMWQRIARQESRGKRIKVEILVRVSGLSDDAGRTEHRTYQVGALRTLSCPSAAAVRFIHSQVDQLAGSFPGTAVAPDA